MRGRELPMDIGRGFSKRSIRLLPCSTPPYRDTSSWPPSEAAEGQSYRAVVSRRVKRSIGRVEGVASRIGGENKNERSSASELVNVRFSQIRSETIAPLGRPVPFLFFFFFSRPSACFVRRRRQTRHANIKGRERNNEGLGDAA